MTYKKHPHNTKNETIKVANNDSDDFIAASLFDGMSCLQLALNKIGKIPTKYYASEVDKYVMHVTNKNFPNTIQLGDVTNVKGSDLGFVHLLAGGSPCQSFSFAGKRKGMSTKDNIEILTLDHYLELKSQNFEFEGQSYLFWEFIRILQELRAINPNIKFLLENVIMSKKWKDVITKSIGIHPIKINAALVSAQNRNRLYWTNIGSEPDGLFGDLKCMIPQPNDKGILLKDILQTDVADKYFLSGKMLDYLNSRKANYNRGKINYKTGNDIASCINSCSGQTDISENIIIDTRRKSKCFTAGGNSGGLHSQMDLIQCVSMRGRNPENPKSRVAGLPTEQILETRNDGKTNCITTAQKDNLVRQINPSTESNNCQPYMQNRVYDINGLNPALTTLWNGANLINTEPTIRRLTPIECERLQCVPDNYTNHVSDTQRYKMLGNGWNIDVIAHILSYLT